jgi:hypothetical protein
MDSANKGNIVALDVLGSFEYCEEFGTYHCTTFRAQYQPSSQEFVPAFNVSDVGCPESGFSEPNGDNIPLLRCAQPGETGTVCSHA